jgi:(2Fe-2S) ferredoxin
VTGRHDAEPSITNRVDLTQETPTPGLTVCSLCVGETLGDSDPQPGGQLARLQRLEACGTTRLTLAECLDECERGDVVVVRPAPATRGRRARPVWLERLAGDELTGVLGDWLADGGPGRAPTPRPLRSHLIPRAKVQDPS